MIEINTLVKISGWIVESRMLTFPGLPLRELIYEYKHQTLVLFKCCLLQPKVMIWPEHESSNTNANRCCSLDLDARGYA